MREKLRGKVRFGRVQVKGAQVQGAISVGDGRVGMAIYHHVVGGLSWREAWRREGVDLSFLYEGRGDPLPWDFVKHTTGKGFLRREWERSLEVRRKFSYTTVQIN